MPRTVMLASADADLRQRLMHHLTTLRWQVREAVGGADALAQLESAGAEALLIDDVLPDLEVAEFTGQVRSLYPAMDVLSIDGGADEMGARSPRRNELLYALRRAQEDLEGDTCEPIVGATQHTSAPLPGRIGGPDAGRQRATLSLPPRLPVERCNGVPDTVRHADGPRPDRGPSAVEAVVRRRAMVLPEMIGEGAAMWELARLVRLVAPRSTTVLIEGATGTGKELIAKALHRLSTRAAKPFVVLNCAAIPEALLEAELFGHTRGAFTGAVQSRTGRIEAAHGGTLFLDEIGEMPIALQAKMLRFLESGELQRVGDNDTVRVDVRIIAATHQPLQRRSAERAFRLDLYHRLAVFPLTVPALRDRLEDVLPLAGYLLDKFGEDNPVKRLSAAAAAKLLQHEWPGNVRELAHVLERAMILAEDRLEIAPDEIRL